jgi:hypothetical protein
MATHRTKSVRWLAPMTVVVGAFGLAACGGDDPPDTVEVSSGNRAAQLTEADRYADLQKDRRSRACKWISVGAPPTPHYVLVLESCDGEWTGNVEWVQPRSAGASRGSLISWNCVAQQRPELD